MIKILDIIVSWAVLCFTTLQSKDSLKYRPPTVRQPASRPARPLVIEWSSDFDDVFGIVVIAFSQQAVTEYHDYLPGNAPFDRTLSSLELSKLLVYGAFWLLTVDTFIAMCIPTEMIPMLPWCWCCWTVTALGSGELFIDLVILQRNNSIWQNISRRLNECYHIH